MPRASLPSLPFPECQPAYGSGGWPVLVPTLRQHPGFTPAPALHPGHGCFTTSSYLLTSGSCLQLSPGAPSHL